ncbi:MAG: DUF4177 domain-containing protein [Microthrixaceae bacterium]
MSDEHGAWQQADQNCPAQNSLLSAVGGVAAASDSRERYWEYKVISATFGGSLEAELNTWGREGWEVISIAGMGGTATLTGNKLFVVLKKRALTLENARARARQYLGVLKDHYGSVYDSVVSKHGPELFEGATSELIVSGRQPNNPLGLLDLVCDRLSAATRLRGDELIRQVWHLAEGEPFPD